MLLICPVFDAPSLTAFSIYLRLVMLWGAAAGHLTLLELSCGGTSEIMDCL